MAAMFPPGRSDKSGLDFSPYISCDKKDNSIKCTCIKLRGLISLIFTSREAARTGHDTTLGSPEAPHARCFCPQ